VIHWSSADVDPGASTTCAPVSLSSRWKSGE